MKIRTYVFDGQSDEAKVGNKHLAQLDLGSNLFMSFFGATRIEAIERAENWYTRERARQFKLEAGVDRASHDSENRASINPSVSGLINSGKGSHLRGIAWMVHEVTREKIRVPVAEVEAYVAKGYFKGGARSK